MIEKGSKEQGSPGRVLLFTGDGKGKTTAALGMVLRASGHQMKILFIQFVKSDPGTGETAAFAGLPGATIIQTGRGFVPKPSKPEFADHRRAAEEGLKLAGEALRSGRYDMICLDEIAYAVARGLLAEEAVIQAVRQTHPGTIVVLTGRNATHGLIELADTATEMRKIKHGLETGWTAQKGVEA
ncbi:MAG: Cob(I)yrinic acid a,c-diamide adenosyltransferase [Syntrophaceae bacterium PtaU1.Bin231]|nr:MAG: Cob(I)yrinic acid a,c-diamide adenosyltransferase [Syntrophaceae bacterium PtaU1.Bin231]